MRKELYYALLATIAIGLLACIAAASYAAEKQMIPKQTGIAIPVAAGALAFGLIYYLGERQKRTAAPGRVGPLLKPAMDHWQKHEAELRQDPRTAKYAHLARQWIRVTPDLAAYADNPAATRTCPHLEPIERALRTAGIFVYPPAGTAWTVTAQCTINEAGLRVQYALPASVVYSEYFDHRDADACLECAACKSRIWTDHPIIDRKNWFPAKPA